MPPCSIDEFVYQYTSFALWRNKTQGKTDEEKAILAESGQVRTPALVGRARIRYSIF